jgi:hypothetical protein
VLVHSLTHTRVTLSKYTGHESRHWLSFLESLRLAASHSATERHDLLFECVMNLLDADESFVVESWLQLSAHSVVFETVK